MSDTPGADPGGQSSSQAGSAAHVCRQFEDAWQAGQQPRLEDYLNGTAEWVRSTLLRDLLSLEVAYRRQRGESPDPQEYRSRFPDHPEVIAAVFRDEESLIAHGLLTGKTPAGSVATGLDLVRRVQEICARFEAVWKQGPRPRIEDYLSGLSESDRAILLRELLVRELAWRRQSCETLDPQEYRRRFPGYPEVIGALFPEEPGGAGPAPEESVVPPRLGRYRILQKLGVGGFGIVYKAHDTELQRDVALKVPHRHRLASPEDAEAFLAEARILARLDHPDIVPVYDVGRDEAGTYYLVSKLIEGTDLRTRMKQGRLPVAEAVSVVVRVAEALHYAHQHGLVHRDIKPGNILLDATGRPVVTDFGMALREEDFGCGPGFAGTPAYMSPEQARGEGHRVDARTDVYSLGVVLYELLTGRRPFWDDDQTKLLEQVIAREPRPVRQLDDHIPRDLDRICLKALSKRAADRYSTAIDLAEDLRHWQSEDKRPARRVRRQPPTADTTPGPSSQEQPLARPEPPPATAPGGGPRPVESAAPDSDPQPVRVVPKGLRSFDAEDADFFLDLLPGPCDREGLPDSLRFWKRRLDATDPERTFSVGLLYAPSGCGKTSLVRAGLLPRLAGHVRAVYLEASSDQTESRILHALRRTCPDLPDHLSLADALTNIRRGHGLPCGQKVLLVLDQFEQWLHARREEPNAELVQALRQCDGQHVQCLLMVRDDFGMAVTRFLHDLEVPIVEGHNFATVDLFDARHARKVLERFGRSFGALPDYPAALSREQEQLLDEAVAGLARDGKVIPVRLALFAEMIKTKPWVPATLKEVGGTQGLGVAFLEETFGDRCRHPEHRVHQRAIRAVLKALLPEHGTDLKGHTRSYAELLEHSGYAHRPREFADLMRILDAELRLVTPSDDPASVEASARRAPPVDGSEQVEHIGLTPRRSPEPDRYYQLTHDYLVPALHQWLTRQQRETRRGRAELRLAGLAAQWQADPAKRQLPTWWEWANIRLFTRRQDWTPPQRQMMRTAARYHVAKGLAVAILGLSLVLLGSLELRRHHLNEASMLVDRLLDADVASVPKILEELGPYRDGADPKLAEVVADGRRTPKERLHAHLGLLAVDPSQGDPLFEALLTAEPDQLVILRDALREYRPDLSERLWGVLADGQAKPAERFRAACALAGGDVDGQRWARAGRDVADRLVKENLLVVSKWADILRPMRQALVPPLADLVRAPDRPESEQLLAASLLADFGADQPEVMAELVMNLEPRKAAILLPALQAHREQALERMCRELDEQPAAQAPEAAKELLAKRQANAAAALLWLGQPQRVWPLFQYPPGSDPRRRTYLIHAVRPLGINAELLVQRLKAEPDVSARRALLLCLGELTSDQLPVTGRQALTEWLRQVYREDPDPGVHSAADWVLRRWHQQAELRQLDRALGSQGPPEGRGWYVNRQGQTLAVVPSSVELDVGSPEEETDRTDRLEDLFRARIPRSFAVATKEVTAGQFEQFLEGKEGDAFETIKNTTKKRSSGPDGPVLAVSWFKAAQYCNWLSEQEGIPPDQWCFRPNKNGEYAEGMRLAPNYLHRTGYRLPTEAEWEYACRAGAATSRAYGDSEAVLTQYAWYSANAQGKAWPVGQLKPNDLGLFDMYGNAAEWTLSPAAPYPRTAPGHVHDDLEIDRFPEVEGFVLRGGGFTDAASCARSAFRNQGLLTNYNAILGLRVARTLSQK